MKRYKRGAEERVHPHKEQPVFHVQKPQVLAIAALLPVRSTTCNTGRPSLFVINKRGSMTKGKESCSVIDRVYSFEIRCNNAVCKEEGC